MTHRGGLNIAWSWEDTPVRLIPCTLVNTTTCLYFAQGSVEAASRGATPGWLRARRAPSGAEPTRCARIPAEPGHNEPNVGSAQPVARGGGDSQPGRQRSATRPGPACPPPPPPLPPQTAVTPSDAPPPPASPLRGIPEGEANGSSDPSTPSPRGIFKHSAQATEPGGTRRWERRGDLPHAGGGSAEEAAPRAQRGSARPGSCPGQSCKQAQVPFWEHTAGTRSSTARFTPLSAEPLRIDIIFWGPNIPKSKPKPLCLTRLTASSKFSKRPSTVRCHSHRDGVSSSFPSLCSLGMQRAISSLARSLDLTDFSSVLGKRRPEGNQDSPRRPSCPRRGDPLRAAPGAGRNTG